MMEISENNYRELMGDTSLWLAQTPQLRLATDTTKLIEDGGEPIVWSDPYTLAVAQVTYDG